MAINKNSMTIYDRIREQRELLGMTQEELANKMGYKSRSTIAKIESGENDIPQSKVKAFAMALDTTTAFLMGWEDEEIEEKKHDGTGDKEQAYYFDPETAKMAQVIFEQKDMRVLFDALRNASPENLKIAANLVKTYMDSATNQNNDDGF